MDKGTESKKIDRRKARSKKALRNAILDLTVARGEFNSIQISEITEKADVARSTFYLHYGDKEELLYDALEVEFTQFLTDIELHYQKAYAPFHIPSVLRYIDQHPRYFRVVLTCVGTSRATEQTRRIFEEWLTSAVDFSVFDPSIPSSVITYHITGTIFNIIKWWLEQDEPYSPQEIEGFYANLLFDGVLKVLNVESKDEMDRVITPQLSALNTEKGYQ